MDWANWSMSRKILLPASALLLIFMSFFNWQQACVTVPGFGERCAGVSGWHGAAGAILGLLTIALLVWELVEAFLPDVRQNVNVPSGLVGGGLAAAVTIFVLIKFISANEVRAWPAWVCLVLGIVIAYGGWLRFSESGEALPTRASMGGGGTPAASTPPPAPPPPPAADAGGGMGGGGGGMGAPPDEERPPA